VSSVPDSNPAAKSFRFDACWQGQRITGTAVARADQIELHPIPGLCLEIPVEGFGQLAAHLMVAAHTRRPDAGA
jgi:hypothetical protein